MIGVVITNKTGGGSARWESGRQSGNESCRVSMRFSEVRRQRRRGNAYLFANLYAKKGKVNIKMKSKTIT